MHADIEKLRNNSAKEKEEGIQFNFIVIVYYM